jgi:hypothetical protein
MRGEVAGIDERADREAKGQVEADARQEFDAACDLHRRSPGLAIAEADYVAACERHDWAAAGKARNAMFVYAARIEWFSADPAGAKAETLH